METLRDNCSICLDIIKEQEISTLSPCSHSFCFPCITGWLEQKSQCPLCMKESDVLTYLATQGVKKQKSITAKNEKPKEEAKDQKIDTKQLVEDIHHFTETLTNFNSKGTGKAEKYDKFIDYYDECYEDEYYDEDIQYFVVDDDDCYGMDAKVGKKARKNKNKSKKKAAASSNQNNTTLGSNTTVMLH